MENIDTNDVLTVLLAARDHSLAGLGITVAFNVILIYISAGLALLSLAVYMRNIRKTWARKAEGSMGADNLFKPMLSRGQLRCIGATTLEEYRKYVEKDAAFERRFQHVFVAEPGVADSISILRGLKEKYEGHQGVRIQDRVLVVAEQLRSQYITGRRLPDKVIDLVDEVCANVRVQLDSQP